MLAGPLRLNEELADAADSKGKVRGLDAFARAERLLLDDVPVCLGISRAVIQIPAQCGKERVEKIVAEGGF
jgi:hypothetical protein